jgi:putative Ca2+/H+ antiporter (TMEM165/GDT1 family)
VNAGIAVATLLLVLPVELPDKTLLATLVLATRYRALPVLLGVSAAFAVQCAIAVSAGKVLTLLPERLVATIVAVLFGVGGWVLLRAGEEEHDEEAITDRQARGPWSVAVTSFGVLFAAEWGDASQLATAGITARYGEPLAVGLGAWLALVAVAGLAVLVGRKLAGRLPTHWIQRVAGSIFAVFAVIALTQVF